MTKPTITFDKRWKVTYTMGDFEYFGTIRRIGHDEWKREFEVVIDQVYGPEAEAHYATFWEEIESEILDAWYDHFEKERENRGYYS